MNESDLLMAYRETGSEKAFAVLIRHYTNLVFSIAKRRLDNGALAEDVTQTVFTRLAKNPPKIRHQAELAAWLHRTTVHVSIDLWRAETRRRAREQQAAAMQSTPNEETRVWEELTPQLDGALDELADADRQAVLLRFFEGKAMREIGQSFGVSEDAAKMRVSRAIEKLRKQLALRGITCTGILLGTILLHRAVEAAPSQLAATLTALKLATPIASGAGLTTALLPLLKSKVIVGTTAILAVAILSWWLLRPGNNKEAAAVVAADAPEIQPPATPLNPIFAKHGTKRSPPAEPEAPADALLILQVVDAETGTGLVDAKVHVAHFYAGGEGEGHEVRTDGNGLAPIPKANKPASRGFNLFVSAESYVPKAMNWHGRTLTNYTLRLDPGLTVGGVVVDESGQPVADVKVGVQNPDRKGSRNENVDFQLVTVQTDAQGRWQVTYIPRDLEEIRFNLSQPGYAATHVIVPARGFDLRDLVLVIDRGFSVIGRIADADGNPIAGAQVGESHIYGRRKHTARTREDGTFILSGVAPLFDTSKTRPPATNAHGMILFRGLTNTAPGEIDMVIEAEGFAPLKRTMQLPELTNRLDVTLAKGRVFRGRVVDESGKPIARAAVRTEGDGDFEWFTHTDAEGHFLWDSAPEHETRYYIEADGFTWVRDLALLADGSEHEIELRRSAR